MDRARRYSFLRYIIFFINLGVSLLFLSIIYLTGVSSLLKELSSFLSRNRFGYIAGYTLFLGLSYYVVSFAIHLYGSYILEHKFSLSTQGFKGWLKDEIKEVILSLMIALVLIEAFYFIVDRFRDLWPILMTLFWIIFSMILTMIFPTVILPLFFKYKKLQDSDLKEKIFSLAKKLEIKILDVFEIDLSKKSLKANAALAGLGKTKRALVSDTLRDKYSLQEIEVILAHEFSHFKLNHILKHVVINTVFVFFSFCLISYLFRSLEISIEDIKNFPILAISFILIGVIYKPLQNFISRRFEANADILSLRVTKDTDSFISVMERLANQNLSLRNPNLFIKLFFFDHPPIDERIKMAIDFKD